MMIALMLLPEALRTPVLENLVFKELAQILW